ncbi:predicted protein [Naegleria gruberi]|uniref:Predicted protein n=1 Tax=Naegleria gruberi TaxID=5762 RepID=D2VS24_NAEGR|nr:uncharacterized protein NAEGRDRAFT_51805 [Naegleria gruberi]EFC40345.1 predicted protein [Naegleria gruberi]|eukprot:XP_002673089.1 predicted protein [Naegleria gruberi strain NEG-M]
MQESSSAAVVEDSTMELASPSSLKYKSSSLIIHQDTNLTHPIYNILSFLDFDELIHTVALVSKATHYAVHHSVEHLTLDSENTNFGDVEHLSEEEQQNHNMTNMIDIVNRFPSLKVLSLDGLDFFTDVCLSKLVENLPPHLSEIHIRECPLDSPIILDKKSMNSESFSQSSDTEYIPSIQQLKVLRFSAIKFTSFEVGYLKNLLSLEFYDSSFEKCLKIIQCSKLDRLICFKCTGLGDTLLLATLKSLLYEEVAHLQSVSNTNSQTEENDLEGKPADNDDDSIFDTARNVKNRKYGSLKKLYLTECEPLTNPVIQSNTIEEIKIIDCKYLSKPFISCPALNRLQLNWCENLKSLNLACDNLQFIDLTGAGVTYSNSQSNSQGSATSKKENTILHNVIGGLRKHYGEQLKIAL